MGRSFAEADRVTTEFYEALTLLLICRCGLDWLVSLSFPSFSDRSRSRPFDFQDLAILLGDCLTRYWYLMLMEECSRVGWFSFNLGNFCASLCVDFVLKRNRCHVESLTSEKCRWKGRSSELCCYDEIFVKLIISVEPFDLISWLWLGLEYTFEGE